MPAALDMEKCVLSAMLQAPDFAVAKASQILKPHHFHGWENRRLFEIICECHREGSPVDPVSIQQVLLDRSMMEATGGPAFVAEVYTFAPTPAHVSHYAAQVRDKATLRQVIDACSSAMENAFSNPEDVAAVLDKAEAGILAIRDAEQKGAQILTGKEALWKTLDAIELQMENQIPSGIPSGLPTLDAKAGGIQPGLFLIGAETSGGKSVIAMLFVIALLRAGKRVRYYSLEMTTDLCVRRMLCHLSGLPFNRILNPLPKFTAHELASFERATKEFSAWAHLLTISDDRDRTASAIFADCRQEHAANPLGAVVVDYVQRLTPEDPKASPEQQISGSSGVLKDMADRLNIPVITPVQLNEQNAVRGSRMLGMDSDTFVRIVHERNSDGEPEDPDEHGRRRCGLWVEKIRQGPRWFMIPCMLDGARMSFTETREGPQSQARRAA